MTGGLGIMALAELPIRRGTAATAVPPFLGDPGGARRRRLTARVVLALSGLLASHLLLLQVLVVARIPWLEGIWGQDVLPRQHRMVGFLSFDLMLVHIVTIVPGYAAAARTGLLHQVWILLTQHPGMLLAAAGTLALVAVVATSIRAARRSMRHGSWHLIHLYAYLGVGLALPHQPWTGSDFVASKTAAVFWWTLWAAAAARCCSGGSGRPSCAACATTSGCFPSSRNPVTSFRS